MSEFSNLLSSHLLAKDVKICAIAQYCDLDRSTMYKFINGKRNPSSEDVVHKIGEYLRLSPLEYKDFLEAYRITLVGYDTYYRRKSVLDFFSDFPNSFSNFPYANMNHSSFKLNSSVLPLKGKTEIDHAIHNVIMLEAQKNSGHIKLLIQPDDNFTMKLLTFAAKERETLKIDHIICLNNTEAVTTSKRNYNLLCLKNIMPLYICSCNYNSYYYYDNIISHSNMFNLSPHLILTSEYAISLSADMQYGIIYHDREILHFYHKIYKQFLSNTTKIGNCMSSIFTHLNYFSDLKMGQIPGVSFQTEPCLIPLLTEQMVDRYLIRDLPDRSEFIHRMTAYTRTLLPFYKAGTTKFIFTKGGISSFLKTGRISEIPEKLYAPFSMNDRLLLTRQLLHLCKNNNFRMLNSDIGYFDSKLCVYANSQRGYLLFPSIKNELVYLDLGEPSLLHAFYDFWDTLNNNVFYTKDETIDILNSLMKLHRSVQPDNMTSVHELTT